METTEDGPGAVILRAARPEDRTAIARIDGSFTTDRVLRVRRTDTGFEAAETAVDPPVRKTFPDDDCGEADDPGERTVVAEVRGRVCGFVTTVFQRWNRRLVVADLEVAPAHRGRGIGAALLARAVEEGRRLGAGHVWLEVTHLNAPAVRLYRRAGFELCGLDTSLYSGTASEGETALFMSRPL
ncbi:GNAT family N-acetyltransferase [Streptomyces sp. Ru71]|uniref:GNAT family N-acetyltransferase n=1 Tax=Streptomyces sp. Ru71 TaxID=2080746 RepID=UPI00215614D3|nr:GNAT family N-acetyltransferase [Streptomyces sp. Ru71]